MRPTVLLLLSVFVVGVVHAQLNFGPSGLTVPPINLLAVFRYVRRLWYSFFPRPESAAVDRKDSVNATAVEADSKEASERQFASDLQQLKGRIQAASEVAAKISPHAEQNTARPLSRVVWEPKKQVVIGKWPVVYGVLNGLLLAAALVLAKPYFYTGETVISKYVRQKQDEEQGYEEPVTMVYGATPSAVGDQYEMAAAMPAAADMPASSQNAGMLSPTYSSHMMVLQDTIENIGNMQSYSTSKGKSNERTENKEPIPVPVFGAMEDSESDEYEDIPFSELHYYNPTVFMSNDPSSYACLQRMICLNPSVSARDLALTPVSSGVLPGTADAFNRRRGNSEALVDSNGDDCEQYICPPTMPLFDAVGDPYTPPPVHHTIRDPYTPTPMHHTIGPFGNAAFPSFQRPYENKNVAESAGIYQLNPVVQNGRIESFVPVMDVGTELGPKYSFIDAQEQLKVPKFTSRLGLEAVMEETTSSYTEDEVSPSTGKMPAQSIQWIQAPKIHSAKYPSVAIQKGKSQQKQAYEQLYVYHPKTFVKKATDLGTPVPPVNRNR